MEADVKFMGQSTRELDEMQENATDVFCKPT
jgi:hypothetical protein